MIPTPVRHHRIRRRSADWAPTLATRDRPPFFTETARPGVRVRRLSGRLIHDGRRAGASTSKGRGSMGARTGSALLLVAAPGHGREDRARSRPLSAIMVNPRRARPRRATAIDDSPYEILPPPRRR